MPYIPHPDKPGEVQEIELHMHELMTFQKFNRWDIGRLSWWLKHRPDQIFEAIKRLKDFFADHGDLPQDINEIDHAFFQLSCLFISNNCDPEELGAWLKTYPDIIFDATMRLESMLEEMFPPLEPSIQDGGEDGGVPSHHYQTA